MYIEESKNAESHTKTIFKELIKDFVNYFALKRSEMNYFGFSAKENRR